MASSLTSHLKSYLSVFSHRINDILAPAEKTGSLDQLSDDILVDHIFCYLTVEDIICLRRVSKIYYALTHHPIIWKRFLRLMRYPIPSDPPTTRYIRGAVSTSDAERRVVRAITLDDNWRAPQTLILRQRSRYVGADVLSMVMLPGGKYMVASIRDDSGRRYYVAVFLLDGLSGFPSMVARFPIDSKAYDLQAKYTSFNIPRNGPSDLVPSNVLKQDDFGQDGVGCDYGEFSEGFQTPIRDCSVKGTSFTKVPGITLAFLRRDLSRKKREKYRIDPSDYAGTDIDPPVPLRYHCVCLHLSIGALEELADVDQGIEPFELECDPAHLAPFMLKAEIISHVELAHPAIDIIGGAPHLSVVRDRETITIQDLTVRGAAGKAELKCNSHTTAPSATSTICAFRILASQNQVLVLRRTCDGPGAPAEYPVELFELPSAGMSVHREPSHRTFIELGGRREIKEFYINDPYVDAGCACIGGVPSLDRSPLSIFLGTDSYNMIHLTMRPSPESFGFPSGTSSAAQSLVYRMENLVTEHDIRLEHPPRKFFCVPGQRRTLLYTVDPDNRSDLPGPAEIWGYMHKEAAPDSDAHAAHQITPHAVTRGRKLARTTPQSFICSTYLADPDGIGRLRAIAFDESVGRLCVSMDGDDRIYIMDLAHIPSLGRITLSAS